MHFGEEVMETFTHADGRLIRTIRALTTCPGELTNAYMTGHRKRYVGPLQLFLILNLIFFLIGSLGFEINPFTTPLQIQTHASNFPYAEWAKQLVDQRLVTRRITLEAYTAVFDHATATQAKSLVIVMVPVFAVWVGLVTLPRRRAFVQHLVFSLHTFTMLFVILTATVAIINAIVAWKRTTGGHIRISDAMITLTVGVAFVLYLARALRRAYGGNVVAFSLRAVAPTLSLVFVLTAYRMLLFFVTFLTT
ncbi:MAG: DUF3667 domain-containing protein [Gemmatimonadaceae bacterium]